MNAELITQAGFAFGKAVLKSQGKKVENSKLGKILAASGLLTPSLMQILRNTVERTVMLSAEKLSQNERIGFLKFASDPAFSDAIVLSLFEAEILDIGSLILRLADYLDISKADQRDPSIAMHLDSILSNFFAALRTQLAKESDVGTIVLSQHLQKLDRAVTDGLSELENIRADLPKILQTAQRDQQSLAWQEFESSFIEHLANRFERLTIPGVRELHGTSQSLSLAYISLKLSSENVIESTRRAEQIIIENSYVAVRGPAGSGKTTLLTWIALSCAGKEGCDAQWVGLVPFFIPLRSFTRTAERVPLVENLVRYSVDEKIWAKSANPEWVFDLLKNQKRAVLMFDGFDEFPRDQRDEFWDWLDVFMNEYPGNRIVITSRVLPLKSSEKDNKVFSQWRPPTEFLDAMIEAMSKEDIKEFIRHWHDSVRLDKLHANDLAALRKARDTLPLKLDDPANRRILELCSTPLLCAMVCILNWQEEGYLPTQRVELYDRCCNILIEERDKKREIAVVSGPLAAITKSDKDMILQRLAFDMMSNKPDADVSEGLSDHQIEISRDQALAWIEPRISSFRNPVARDCTAEQVLDFLIERSGLLREPATGIVDFPHRSFQEYLAACAAGADGQQNLLAKLADDDQWHETIKLAAGTTAGGVRFGFLLIEALLKRAQAHKGQKYSSRFKRRTCVALALGAFENLRQQNPELRDKLYSFIDELVPPESSHDARALAVAGDVVVPYLAYESWRNHSFEVASACAATLFLIGTQRAKSVLADAKTDERFGVLHYVVASHAADLQEIPELLNHVKNLGSLPSYCRGLSVEEAASIPGVKHLVFSRHLPEDINNLAKIKDLKGIHFEEIDIGNLSAKLPDSIGTLSLVKPDAIPDWLSTLPTLSELNIYAPRFFSENNPLKDLKFLRTLRIGFMPITNTDFLGGYMNLEALHLDGVSGLKAVNIGGNLETLRELGLYRCDSLKRIDGAGGSKVSDLTLSSNASEFNSKVLESFAELERLKLVKVPDLISLRSLSSISTLKILSMANCQRLEDVSALVSASRIENLVLEDCVSVRDIPPLTSSVLKRIQISELRGLQSLDFLAGATQLKRLVVGGTGVADMHPLANLKELEVLHLRDCPLGTEKILRSLTNVRSLRLINCHYIKDLSFVSELPNLMDLMIVDAASLTSLNGLQNSSVEDLTIGNCQKLEDMSALKQMKSLSELTLHGTMQGDVPEFSADVRVGRHSRFNTRAYSRPYYTTVFDLKCGYKLYSFGSRDSVFIASD